MRSLSVEFEVFIFLTKKNVLFIDSPLTYSSARGRALIDSGGRLICCDEMKSEGSCEFCDNDGDDACGAVGIGNWKCKYTSVLSG